MIFYSTLIGSVLTIFTPLSAKYGYIMLIIVRFLIGLAHVGFDALIFLYSLFITYF